MAENNARRDGVAVSRRAVFVLVFQHQVLFYFWQQHCVTWIVVTRVYAMLACSQPHS